jgi:hypothetical protein
VRSGVRWRRAAAVSRNPQIRRREGKRRGLRRVYREYGRPRESAAITRPGRNPYGSLSRKIRRGRACGTRPLRGKRASGAAATGTEFVTRTCARSHGRVSAKPGDALAPGRGRSAQRPRSSTANETPPDGGACSSALGSRVETSSRDRMIACVVANWADVCETGGIPFLESLS